MTLELALAKIKVLEEANIRLSGLVNHFLNQPGPAAIEYQKLLAASEKEKVKNPTQK